MESLALLVAFLLLSTLLSGPIALGLTYLRVRSKNGERMRKIAVALFSLWGSMSGVQFALSAFPLFVRLFGGVGVAVSLFAVKKEFGGPRKLKER